MSSCRFKMGQLLTTTLLLLVRAYNAECASSLLHPTAENDDEQRV